MSLRGHSAAATLAHAGDVGDSTALGMTWFRVAAGAACLIAVAACTPDRTSSQGLKVDDITGAAEVRCEDSDPVEPSPDAQALADGVALSGSFAAVDAGRQDGLMFAKGGLWVRGSTAVRLTVTKPSDALLSWGKPGTSAGQVVVSACGGAEWRVWPGGVYVTEPTTVTLKVETEQGAVSVPIDVMEDSLPR